jgi:hypothetical protein
MTLDTVRRARPGAALTAALLAALAPAAPSHAQATAPDPRDYRVIVRVPREEVDSWLKEEVRRSGGDIDRDRYHFVIGFSTGHYGTDPVHAIAMRRIAFSLLNNTFAPGDRVTPVAWEMSVWDTGQTIKLTDDPQTRAAFVDAVPYAPAEGSRGGHDTERALYETLTKSVTQGDARSTILLLLTNTNQSQGPTGTRAELFGANNRRLADAIQSNGYRSPVRHSFRAEAEGRSLNVDVTALFPKQLESLPDGPGLDRFPAFPIATWQPPADRPQRGDSPPNTVHPSIRGPGGPGGMRGGGAPRRGRFPWPLLLGAAVLAAGVIALLMRGRGKRPDEAAVPAPVPKGKPLPGSVKAIIGSAPHSQTVTLTPLTTASRWSLAEDADGKAVLSEEEEPGGTRLARVSIDDRRRLALEADGDAVFQNVSGAKPDGANPRRLMLAPGDHLVCRIASASTTRPPTRLELMYQEKA